jgi:hypothetical protein
MSQTPDTPSDTGQQSTVKYVRSDDFLLKEYGALRDEILKQTEIEFQLTAFTLIVASTFLTLGLQQQEPVAVPLLLLYPVISVFFAIQWISRVRIEYAIARYVMETFEAFLPSRTPPLGWERWSRAVLVRTGWGPFKGREARNEGSKRSIFRLTLYGARGLFFSTGSLAVLLAIYRTNAAEGIVRDLWNGVIPSVLSQPQALTVAAFCILDALLIVLTTFGVLRVPRIQTAGSAAARSDSGGAAPTQ